MDTGFEKRKRLACVAQRYYLEDQRQRDTAREPDALRGQEAGNHGGHGP